MAEEWDVFQMLPGTDAPVFLATLYEAYQKTIRVELNGPGAGSFAINRTSPECTEAILAQGNLVKVRIPEIDDDYIFAFFLETGDFTLISSEEGGGEMLTFGGRGILSYLEYACAWSESYIAGGQDPIAGVWRAYAAGTGNKPGQILRRLLEEFQDPDRPQEPLPHLTIDFDYDDDSSADTWDATAATDEFSYQVGEDGMAIVQRLIDTDTITVQMTPGFLLQAWNIDNFGRDLTGDSFGASVVRFERGENIATELRRELAVLEVKTHMLAGGEADQYGTASLADAASRVTKEGFIASFGTGTTALNGVAASELQDRLRKSDTIQFPIANRRTADVVLSSPVSVGSTLGPGAISGRYLPGPEGTNGDFWVGDTVRVHTGSGQFDYNETDWRVQAITITRDDENKELIVIPELVSPTEVETPCVGSPGPYQIPTPESNKSAFTWEITGVEPVPIDSLFVTENTATGTFNPGGLDAAGTETEVLLLFGYVFGNDTDAAGPGGFNSGGNFASTLLTIDHDKKHGIPPNDYLLPESVTGHRLLTNPTAGTYLGSVTRAEQVHFGANALALKAKAGESIVIRQSKYTEGTLGAGDLYVTLDDDPLGDSVLVSWVTVRSGSGSLDRIGVPSGWTGLNECSTHNITNVGNNGRMMYRGVECE